MPAPTIHIGDPVVFTLENGDMIPGEDGNPSTTPVSTAAIVTGVHPENETVDVVIFIHSSTAPFAYAQFGRMTDKGGISYGTGVGEWHLATESVKAGAKG